MKTSYEAAQELIGKWANALNRYNRAVHSLEFTLKHIGATEDYAKLVIKLALDGDYMKEAEQMILRLIREQALSESPK